MTDCVSADPELHYVGGSKNGWKPDFMNYTADWASHEHFKVGDWLYFGFDRKFFNVLEVNETDYQTCSSDHPITVVSQGAGRDVFNLTEAKSYYFLSAGGYCWHGMKLAVFVPKNPQPVPVPTPAQAPAPSRNNGSPSKFPLYKAFMCAIAAAVLLVVTMT
ncbi:Plastocyanin-like [Macleaya cordata]|uniref:Plastocyanin-like n=1 Tax=Macleaya cordata TaxID=56857 RepID=A0A200QEH4_MACCD|nr:Plastocyanin-like [Macleaya cordata]